MKLKAVILAAGRGNRISAVAQQLPKPFLPMDGQTGSVTFVDWHLQALAQAGVSDVYLVGNSVTCGMPVRQPAGLNVEWILNPTEDLSTSGSGHSAWFAWNHPAQILDGRSRVFLMDADIAYDPEIISVLKNAPGKSSKTLISGRFRDSQEEVVVFGSPDAPRFHGKGMLGTPVAGGLDCLGEATGILLWEPEHHELLKKVTDWLIHFSTAKARTEHEDITQRMMLLNVMSAVMLKPHHLFMEVDTPEEYQELTQKLYPQLKKHWRA